MKIYPSYEAAKIANKDQDIYKYGDKYQLGNTPCRPNEEWFKCNPADHCMTVEKFLADGHKFVGGDVFIDDDGDVEIVGDINFYDPEGASQPHEDDNNRYILRAAVLEGKQELKPLPPVNDRVYVDVKPRTKVEYEKVNFEDTMDMFGDEVEIESDLFFQWSQNNVVHVSEISGRDLIMNRHKLVRKIESPVEWWEDVAEFAGNCDGVNNVISNKGGISIIGKMTRDQWCDFARILLEQND